MVRVIIRGVLVGCAIHRNQDSERHEAFGVKIVQKTIDKGDLE